MTDVTSTSVKLTWQQPNKDDIQYYTISHKPRSASQSPGVISGVVTMYYTIHPLSPYTQYEFTISAVNGFGHGPPSPPVVATTGESGKPASPVSGRGSAGFYTPPDPTPPAVRPSSHWPSVPPSTARPLLSRPTSPPLASSFSRRLMHTFYRVQQTRAV